MNPTHTRIRHLTATAAVLVASALAACGGDASTTATPESTPDTVLSSTTSVPSTVPTTTVTSEVPPSTTAASEPDPAWLAEVQDQLDSLVGPSGVQMVEGAITLSPSEAQLANPHARWNPA